MYSAHRFVSCKLLCDLNEKEVKTDKKKWKGGMQTVRILNDNKNAINLICNFNCLYWWLILKKFCEFYTTIFAERKKKKKRREEKIIINGLPRDEIPTFNCQKYFVALLKQQWWPRRRQREKSQRYSLDHVFNKLEIGIGQTREHTNQIRMMHVSDGFFVARVVWMYQNTR